MGSRHILTWAALIVALETGGAYAAAQCLVGSIKKGMPRRAAVSGANKLFRQGLINGDGHGIVMQAIHAHK